MRDQGLSVSQELDFWEKHLPQLRGVGFMPDSNPEPEPITEPDVSDLSMEEFAANRERFGLGNTGDFIGVRQWRRPEQPTKE